jgi:hypothetical protein
VRTHRRLLPLLLLLLLPARVFPPPAPAGPYINGLPSPTVAIQDTWDLDVVDLNDTARGVIAGGWAAGTGVVATPLPPR